MASEKFDKNTLEIERVVESLDNVNYDLIAAALPKMLAEGSVILDASAYQPSNPETKIGVGRYLVYEHKDPGNEFSIWAFAFAPQQRTSIHDHKYRGTVTVIEGVLSEKFYTPFDDRTAELKSRFDRYRFHTTHDDKTDTPQIVHQLKYRKGMIAEAVAVSLHIYDMPAFKLDGTEHNRNLLSIFRKIPSASLKPDYESLTSEKALVSAEYRF